LYYDPECLTRWATEEAGSVLLHEAGHLLRDHAGRALSIGIDASTHHRFNVAGDLEINDDLTDIPLPQGGLKPGAYGLPTGELAEGYFAALGPTPVTPSGWWCSGGSGATGVGQAWELGDDPSTPLVRLGEDELIRQQVATEIRRLLNAGAEISSSTARWANAFLNPRVDWRRRLAGAVRGAVGSASGAVDYRYGQPSRRTGSSIGRAVILPRLVQPIPRVAVVVDTSASMDETLLARVLGELRGILRSAGVSNRSIVVISCDTAARSTQEVFSVATVELVGGGGTDMGAGLAEAERVRPPCDCVIVLTDGYTLWPSPPPRRVRIIVGIVGEQSGQGAEPRWAEVIRIPA
jgi:predicted metal-dependent peptidase